jgi:hypothetical protein
MRSVTFGIAASTLSSRDGFSDLLTDLIDACTSKECFLENTTSRACSQGRLPELLLLSRRAFLSGGCLYRLLQATSQDRPLQPTDLVTIASNRRLFFRMSSSRPCAFFRPTSFRRSEVATATIRELCLGDLSQERKH